MEDHALIEVTKFPKSPLNPDYNEIWRFEPSNLSFFISFGVGLIKSVFEFSNEHHQSQLLRKIRDIPIEKFSSDTQIEEAKRIFEALLDIMKSSGKSPGYLAKFQRCLAHPDRFDMIYSIGLVARGLFIGKDDARNRSILQGKVDIPEEMLLRSLCESLEINLHILSEKAIVRIDVKESRPLISLHLEGNNYGLIFRSHENSDFSSYPYVLEESYRETNRKKTEKIIRILAEGFNPFSVTSENLSEIPALVEKFISDADTIEMIQQKINNSINKSVSFVPHCGKTHSLEELINNCDNKDFHCPCQKKLSQKNIDEIYGKKLIRGGPRSIKRQAILSGSLESDKSKTQHETKSKEEEDSCKEKLLGESGVNGDLQMNPEVIQEHQLKTSSENSKSGKKLTCKHIGEDPISCFGHQYCTRCRYDKLTGEFKCYFCHHAYSIDEKNKLWEEIAKNEISPIDLCPTCKKKSQIAKKKICIKCGEFSGVVTT